MRYNSGHMNKDGISKAHFVFQSTEPVEETVQEKRRGITEEMLFVGVELHIALTE